MIVVDLSEDEFDWIKDIVIEELDHIENYTKKERKPNEPIFQGNANEHLEFLDVLMRKLSDAYQKAT